MPWNPLLRMMTFTGNLCTTAIPGDTENQSIAKRCLRTHRCGQAEAHGPKAAGGQPTIWLCELEVSGSPHLMLADICGDNWIPVFCQVIQPPDHMLWLDRPIGFLLICQRMCVLPLANLIPPGLPKLLLLPVDCRAQDLI